MSRITKGNVAVVNVRATSSLLCLCIYTPLIVNCDQNEYSIHLGGKARFLLHFILFFYFTIKWLSAKWQILHFG